MIKTLFPFHPSHIEALGRTVTFFAGIVLSPTWYLLHQIIDPYLDLNAVLANGITVGTFSQVLIQFKAIGTDVILFHIVPSLFGCLVVSIVSLFICGWVGDKITRCFIRRYQPAVSGSA